LPFALVANTSLKSDAGDDNSEPERCEWGVLGHKGGDGLRIDWMGSLGTFVMVDIDISQLLVRGADTKEKATHSVFDRTVEYPLENRQTSWQRHFLI
jgi:hypothetical protein